MSNNPLPSKVATGSSGMTIAQSFERYHVNGKWYVRAEEQIYGPYTRTELKEFAIEGRLYSTTEVSRVGSDSWTMAYEDLALEPLFAPSPVNLRTDSLMSYRRFLVMA